MPIVRVSTRDSTSNGAFRGPDEHELGVLPHPGDVLHERTGGGRSYMVIAMIVPEIPSEPPLLYLDELGTPPPALAET